jgi:hypothetical protein
VSLLFVVAHGAVTRAARGEHHKHGEPRMRHQPDCPGGLRMYVTGQHMA